jgi:hypothetical protein
MAKTLTYVCFALLLAIHSADAARATPRDEAADALAAPVRLLLAANATVNATSEDAKPAPINAALASDLAPVFMFLNGSDVNITYAAAGCSEAVADLLPGSLQRAVDFFFTQGHCARPAAEQYDMLNSTIAYTLQGVVRSAFYGLGLTQAPEECVLRDEVSLAIKALKEEYDGAALCVDVRVPQAAAEFALRGNTGM